MAVSYTHLSMVTGSIGMLSSASLREDKLGMYEPSHGSAPDIAGKDIDVYKRQEQSLLKNYLKNLREKLFLNIHLKVLLVQKLIMHLMYVKLYLIHGEHLLIIK